MLLQIGCGGGGGGWERGIVRIGSDEILLGLELGLVSYCEYEFPRYQRRARYKKHEIKPGDRSATLYQLHGDKGSKVGDLIV